MPRRVSYFYDNEVGSYYYGQEHPMKPFRIKMAHQLIVNYGLYRRMNCFVSHLLPSFPLPQTIKVTKDLCSFRTGPQMLKCRRSIRRTISRT